MSRKIEEDIAGSVGVAKGGRASRYFPATLYAKLRFRTTFSARW